MSYRKHVRALPKSVRVLGYYGRFVHFTVVSVDVGIEENVAKQFGQQNARLQENDEFHFHRTFLRLDALVFIKNFLKKKVFFLF